VMFKLDKPALTVGRAPDNDIVIPDSIPNADTVSKHHARLRRDQEDYIVRDLGSKNGLTVNGRQTVENLLQDGDQLGFGTAEAIFHRPLSGSSPADAGGPGPGGAA
jgi:pSer/pThr/pTyr-binding forkhead associated (FHA) protein